MALGVCGLLLSTVGLVSCGGGKGGGNGFPEERPDGAVRLYAPEGPASAQNPAFSPDGQTILFTLFHRGYNAGPAGLYLLALNADGRSRQRLR